MVSPGDYRHHYEGEARSSIIRYYAGESLSSPGVSSYLFFFWIPKGILTWNDPSAVVMSKRGYHQAAMPWRLIKR